MSATFASTIAEMFGSLIVTLYGTKLLKQRISEMMVIILQIAAKFLKSDVANEKVSDF
jgi:hypothetical protein